VDYLLFINSWVSDPGLEKRTVVLDKQCVPEQCQVYTRPTVAL
jgi:hypothetical protein